jgi:hypothetical protein
MTDGTCKKPQKNKANFRRAVAWRWHEQDARGTHGRDGRATHGRDAHATEMRQTNPISGRPQSKLTAAREKDYDGLDLQKASEKRSQFGQGSGLGGQGPATWRPPPAPGLSCETNPIWWAIGQNKPNSGRDRGSRVSDLTPDTRSLTRARVCQTKPICLMPTGKAGGRPAAPGHRCATNFRGPVPSSLRPRSGQALSISEESGPSVRMSVTFIHGPDASLRSA